MSRKPKLGEACPWPAVMVDGVAGCPSVRLSVGVWGGSWQPRQSHLQPSPESPGAPALWSDILPGVLHRHWGRVAGGTVMCARWVKRHPV